MLDVDIILWILMAENWVLQHSKHLLLVIYFSVNTLHLFYVRMKKKKSEEKNILMYAVFFKLGCNVSLAKIICQYLENKLHETPRCFRFNLLGKSTERRLGALSKRRLLEIRKSHLFESFHASKAALCADRAGTVTGRSLLAKLSGGLPTPSSSIPAMILFCSNRSKFWIPSQVIKT